MAIDWEAVGRRSGLGKGTPRRVKKDRKKAEASKALKDCYKAVDARDTLISWVTGRKLVRGAASDAIRLEHHHLDRRSQVKSRVADQFNVISVSAWEADYLDCHYLIPVNGDGEEVHDTRLIHHFAWNPRVVKPRCEPFGLNPRIP